jgi:Methyltransferase FkbM domain
MDASLDQPGGGRTIPASGKKGAIAIERLDRIAHAEDLEFIKMDVEGFEPEVWKGMTAILERGRPLTVFMEFTVGRLADPAGFLEAILGHGFSLEIVSTDQGIVPTSREAILNGPQHVDHMLVFRRG